MIATFATYASPRLNQPSAAGATPSRAVAPAPAAPRASERPPQPAPLRSASIVALTPAAMSALIEAQEHMAGSAGVLDRVDTAEKIDRLISRLDDGDPPPPPTSVASLTVRRLQAARERLF